MTAKFTAGPWYPGHLGNDGHPCECASIISEVYPGAIATVHFDNGKRIGEGGNGCPPRSEAIHNMHLIAALPEMFDALAALDRMNRGVDWCDNAEQARRWANARNVLAKAKGEAM